MLPNDFSVWLVRSSRNRRYEPSGASQCPLFGPKPLPVTVIEHVEVLQAVGVPLITGRSQFLLFEPGTTYIESDSRRMTYPSALDPATEAKTLPVEVVRE